ncbi:MAG: beta-ketoacyl-[acyl-carrier-protein] synthase family protein [Phycisphaeraceae bacterium]|nr:beta-ketoacyl-[acyl-carrier-protein] synthase family protein [Phycisphaeraceae bacterium]MCB9847140.1 beta-ketoacyl-[acyl-carrier-protein] synthase family protein [Phycisphaeraceae bacterium]
MTTSDRKPRVVITGAGWVTPLGDTIDGVWQRLLRGDSGVGDIRRFDASTFVSNFVAQTQEPDLSRILADHEHHADAAVNTRFALSATAQAWKQAGLGDPATPGRLNAGFPALNPRRVGIYLGSGEGLLDSDNFFATNIAAWNAEKRDIDLGAWAEAAYQRLSAARELEQEPNMPVSHIADAFGARGPAFNCLTACAASTQAIGEATEIIRRGEADVMITGGAHTMVHPLGITGFIRLTALSADRNAGGPFSLNRDGFTMGEGAGIIIIEALEHALARGATPLAEIVGFGSSADAFRITDIQPEGLGAIAAMTEALEDAGIDPLARDENGRPPIHYISAHGTGTKENDSIESRAVKGMFKHNAPDIPMSSIKSMMGHLIAAAGAVECITCVQTIRTGMLPPTMRLNTPDPNCDLDYVPNKARDCNPVGGVEVALSNSFGFGGQNDTLVLKRYSG